MNRSAQVWAELLSAPLTELRAEIWEALNAAKEGKENNDALTWPEVIEKWFTGTGRTGPRRESKKTVEARWRNGLDTQDIDVDIMDLGQAMEALFLLRERLPRGKFPRVRRLLYDEPEPTERLFSVLSPETKASQDVTGLIGNWRLLHQHSSGIGYVSWRLTISEMGEPIGGPAAWFEMETSLSQGRSRLDSAPKVVTHKVSGALHAVNAMFYLIGAEGDRQLVTASFETPRGRSTAHKFDRAHGLIQRVGAHGLYAARVVLTPVDDVVPVDQLGRFSVEDAEKNEFHGLMDDMQIIAATEEPATSENKRMPAYLVSVQSFDGS